MVEKNFFKKNYKTSECRGHFSDFYVFSKRSEKKSLTIIAKFLDLLFITKALIQVLVRQCAMKNSPDIPVIYVE